MSRDLTALAVVHLQPIEMDHVIQETNGVRHIQNFFCAIIYFQTSSRIHVSSSLERIY